MPRVMPRVVEVQVQVSKPTIILVRSRLTTARTPLWLSDSGNLSISYIEDAVNDGSYSNFL
jgi:hypothetical protein